MEIPIKIDNFNNGKILTVNVNINNKNAIFLLDTGASTSIIDLRKIDKFTSVKPLKSFSISSINKEIDTYKVRINKFSLGDSILTNKEFNVADLINLNNTFSTNNLNVIDGILGNDIIFELVSKIDIENEILLTKS